MPHAHTAAPSEKKAAHPGPAIEVYTGVLYAALKWDELSAAAKMRAHESIAIISARYGVLRPLDQITPYKEKINSTQMRPLVAKSLDAMNAKLVIDCRSSTYKSVWQAPVAITVEIKVLTKVNGVKKIVTHMSKKTRGEVTHLLLQSSTLATSPNRVQEIVSKSFECTLIEYKNNQPWVLEVYC